MEKGKFIACLCQLKMIRAVATIALFLAACGTFPVKEQAPVGTKAPIDIHQSKIPPSSAQALPEQKPLVTVSKPSGTAPSASVTDSKSQLLHPPSEDRYSLDATGEESD